MKHHAKNPSISGIISHPLKRALLDQFNSQSFYTQIPMVVSTKIKKYLTEIDIADRSTIKDTNGCPQVIC
ncbi:hypothetical protein FRB94_001566 [Tulasnella sp. JGI-2019a]|nr:hypothetical protein FRB94_001566 [Tulasnella sp. JGI-2019a]